MRVSGIGSERYSYQLLRNSPYTYYYSWVVCFDELEGQQIWFRTHDDYNFMTRIHISKIIIKQDPSSLAFSQLTIVSLDTVLLNNWVVVEEWMMRIVLELDVR